jgi:hypothetical protein
MSPKEAAFLESAHRAFLHMVKEELLRTPESTPEYLVSLSKAAITIGAGLAAAMGITLDRVIETATVAFEETERDRKTFLNSELPS